MKILLDTNFILSCIKAGIDFLEADKFGQLLLPEEVVRELKMKADRDTKEGKRARLALKIIDNEESYESIRLGNNYVDKGVIDYVKDEDNIAVATLDKELKKKVKSEARIVTIRAGKKLQLE
jgi:hypothetical protein